MFNNYIMNERAKVLKNQFFFGRFEIVRATFTYIEIKTNQLKHS